MAVSSSYSSPLLLAATRARVDDLFTASSSISTSLPALRALMTSRPPRTSSAEMLMPMLASVEMKAGLTRAIGASNCRVLGEVPPIEAQPAASAKASSARARAVILYAFMAAM